MRWMLKYIPAWTAMLLLSVALYILYPYLRFCLEADTVSYLTIARRYAAGDIDKAINGYWSPWSCWLTSIFIKGGLAPIPSAIIINSIGAMGFIGISHALFLKLRIWRSLQWLLNVTLALFLTYAVYRQWFADIWQAFFLLCALRLFVSDRYIKSPPLWILAGLFGGLAYFSRSYAVPFFMVQAICCSFLLTRQSRPLIMSRWILSSFVAMAVMALFGSLWIWQLYLKYQVWTFSTGAHLNVSWNLMGQQHWLEEYAYLVPPAYSSSPNWWEDPYLSSEIIHYKGGILSFIVLRATTIAANFLRLVSSINALSFVSASVGLVSLGIFFSRRVRARFHPNVLILAFSFLIFPLGYLLRASQESYLWYLVPLSMIIGGLVLQQVLPAIGNKGVRYFIVAVFLAGYLCTPILRVKEMFNDGYTDSRLAERIKTIGLSGTFTSNAATETEKRTVDRLAYYTRQLFYYQPVNNPTYPQLLTEMRKRQVKYYFHFYRAMDEGGYVMKDEQGNALPEVNIGVQSNFKIFLLSKQ